jgi:hypothetical protein
MPVTIDGSGVITGLENMALEKVAAASFSTQASVSVNNCFTSEFDMYRLILNVTASSAVTSHCLRWRASTVDSITGYYNGGYYARIMTSIANGNANVASNAATWNMSGSTTNATTNPLFAVIDVVDVALASATKALANYINFQNDSNKYWFAEGHTHSVATAYDGLTIYPSSGTMTGTLDIYGYKKG